MRKSISIACIALASALFMGLVSWPGAAGVAHAQAPATAKEAPSAQPVSATGGAPAAQPVSATGEVPAAQPGAAGSVEPAAGALQPGAGIGDGGTAAATSAMPRDPAALRQVCEDALRSDAEWRSKLRIEIVRSLVEGEPEPGDAEWRARLKQRMASEVHTEDAQLMLTNKRHVVMAYGALWILVVVFAAAMWIRQRGLRAEIARLEQELRAAIKE